MVRTITVRSAGSRSLTQEASIEPSFVLKSSAISNAAKTDSKLLMLRVDFEWHAWSALIPFDVRSSAFRICSLETGGRTSLATSRKFDIKGTPDSWDAPAP